MIWASDPDDRNQSIWSPFLLQSAAGQTVVAIA
jgi:hypothetical protein